MLQFHANGSINNGYTVSIHLTVYNKNIIYALEN